MPAVDASSAQQPVALALDIGTSSTRALLFDRRGNAIRGSERQCEYDLETTPDGGAFVDAPFLRNLTLGCIDAAAAFARAHRLTVASVGISCFWHSLLGLDRNGRPVTPVLHLADTRSRHAVQRLRAAYDQAAIHDRTGCMLHSSYWPAKLVWLAGADPPTFRAVRRWCGFSDYFLRELTGQDMTSVSMASATGMLDIRACAWDAEIIGIAGIDSASLPPIAADEPGRGLRPECAQRWPELADAPWLPSLGDGACANLGTGSTTRNRIALSLGTTGAMRVLVPHRSGEPLSIPADLWAYRLDHAHVLLGAAISNGGKVLAWLSEVINGDLDGDEMRRAATLDPDGHGLTVLPFLAGERSPIWNDEATAVIAGLTLHTDRPRLLRAGMEAVSLRLARLYTALRSIAAPEHAIVANGAALLRSDAWLQITADALGHPVVALPAEEESSARGAALASLAAAGVIARFDDADDPAAAAREIAPVAANLPVYRRALARQTQLESLLFPAGTSWEQRS